MNHNGKIVYADDDTKTVGQLLRLRIPPLAVGILLGIILSLLATQLEEVIASHVEIAFFIPFVVYIAAAVGTQTESIYIRDLRTGRARFFTYLVKETVQGIVLAGLFGAASWLIVFAWFREPEIAMSVGMSTAFAVALAPLVALLVTEGLKDFREDPAAGSGPIATVVQDMISILIYGFISSIIIL